MNLYSFAPTKWYYVTKIVLAYCEIKIVLVIEKLLKFKAEGHEFAKFLRTVKGQKNLWYLTGCFFYLFLEISHI